MTDEQQWFFTPKLLFAIAAFAQPALAQTFPPPAAMALTAPFQSASQLQPLFEFEDTDIKFNLTNLMIVLRDREHEDWVLAAYPDPNTGRPLIGAGFSLDVVATDHPQYDSLNPNQFLEPSSAQLWQAAGLDPDQLQRILDQFDRDLQDWGERRYRRKIRTRTLPPQLTDEQATRLLRISAIQSVVNAKAYCRNFDQLNGRRQMALSQLVFQMGINLEEFVEFLSELNGDTGHRDLSLPDGGVETDADHWRNVQNTLIDSQWARRYTTRAATVIAMFDPNYSQNPAAAEQRITNILHPPERRHRRKTTSHAKTSAHSGHPSHSKTPAKIAR